MKKQSLNPDLGNFVYGPPSPHQGPGYSNPFLESSGYVNGHVTTPENLPAWYVKQKLESQGGQTETDENQKLESQGGQTETDEKQNPFTMESLMPYLQNRDHAMLGGLGVGGTLGGLMGGGKGMLLGSLLGAGGGYLANQWASNQSAA